MSEFRVQHPAALPSVAAAPLQRGTVWSERVEPAGKAEPRRSSSGSAHAGDSQTHSYDGTRRRRRTSANGSVEGRVSWEKGALQGEENGPEEPACRWGEPNCCRTLGMARAPVGGQVLVCSPNLVCLCCALSRSRPCAGERRRCSCCPPASLCLHACFRASEASPGPHGFVRDQGALRKFSVFRWVCFYPSYRLSSASRWERGSSFFLSGSSGGLFLVPWCSPRCPG